MGLSRDTWAQVWITFVMGALAIGIALLGFGFNLAEEGNGDVWIRLGWVGVLIGVAASVVGGVLLVGFRPKDASTKPPSRIDRLLQRLLSLRISIGFKPDGASWLSQVANRDSENLGATLHQFEPRQDGNVSFDLDHERQPSIIFVFRYVNASVYTLQVRDVDGPLQVDGKVLSGRFLFEPLEVAHSQQIVIVLRFVIDIEASERAMRSLIEAGEKIHFNLNAVRVPLQAKEDQAVQGNLRIIEQWWKPPSDSDAL